jgi:hypothetical protein
VVNALDGLALDRKIHAAGWNFFFMAAEAKVMFFGAIGAQNIQDSIKRMLEKLKPMNFNSLSLLESLPNDFWACLTPSFRRTHAISNKVIISMAPTNGARPGAMPSRPELERALRSPVHSGNLTRV